MTTLDGAVALIARPWKGLRPDSCPPVLAYANRSGFSHTGRYGRHQQQVDIWKRPGAGIGSPMAVFVPGGAWISGRRVGQGYALLHHLVDRGFIGASIDYRTSPRHRWPAHIEDVRDAVAWARETYQPSLLALVGASAGGHLSALAGLTGAAVDAVVSLYGVYDWTCYTSAASVATTAIAAGLVLQQWSTAALREASPINHLHPDAPPFLIVQGDRDHLTPAACAREFHRRLRGVSQSRAEYLEVRGGHAFDLVRAKSTVRALRGVDDFLDEVQATANP